MPASSSRARSSHPRRSSYRANRIQFDPCSRTLYPGSRALNGVASAVSRSHTAALLDCRSRYLFLILSVAMYLGGAAGASK